MKKKITSSKTILNKRARFDYELSETLIAGIALSGPETKSLRLGHGILRGSFVTVKNNELWLTNMQVNPLKTNASGLPEEERLRARKLLVTKKQLDQLIEAKKSGKNIIPIKLLTSSRYIKVEIIKKRDLERSARHGE